jgi:hypothetical protein
MLLAKGKITPDHKSLLKSWGHSGFHVFCGPRIYPRKEEAMENLVRNIIRASFSREGMTYLPDETRVLYLIQGEPARKSF